MAGVREADTAFNLPLNVFRRLLRRAGVSSNLNAGWANYINGNTSVQNFEAEIETKLELNATVGTGSVNEKYLPLGISGLWNSSLSQFDFSSLSVGDMVDLRIDGEHTTTTVNESFTVNLVSAIGTAKEFSIPIAFGNSFFPITTIVSRYNGIFIGSEEVRANPAELRIITSDDASGKLVDIYIKVIKV